MKTIKLILALNLLTLFASCLNAFTIKILNNFETETIYFKFSDSEESKISYAIGTNGTTLIIEDIISAKYLVEVYSKNATKDTIPIIREIFDLTNNCIIAFDLNNFSLKCYPPLE